jgi:hypothetical protein
VVFLALIIACVLAFTGYDMWQNHEHEANLAAVASVIAGREVEVRCPGFWSSLLNIQARSHVGYGPDGLPEEHTDLTPETCSRLASFADSKTKEPYSCFWTSGASCGDEAPKVAWALTTLAHEAYHLAGVKSEAETQCYAMQALPLVASRLGAEPAHAQALAGYVFANQYPSIQSDYKSSDCRPGGAYDLHPETVEWP